MIKTRRASGPFEQDGLLWIVAMKKDNVMGTKSKETEYETAALCVS